MSATMYWPQGTMAQAVMEDGTVYVSDAHGRLTDGTTVDGRTVPIQDSHKDALTQAGWTDQDPNGDGTQVVAGDNPVDTAPAQDPAQLAEAQVQAAQDTQASQPTGLGEAPAGAGVPVQQANATVAPQQSAQFASADEAAGTGATANVGTASQPVNTTPAVPQPVDQAPTGDTNAGNVGQVQQPAAGAATEPSGDQQGQNTVGTPSGQPTDTAGQSSTAWSEDRVSPAEAPASSAQETPNT